MWEFRLGTCTPVVLQGVQVSSIVHWPSVSSEVRGYLRLCRGDEGGDGRPLGALGGVRGHLDMIFSERDCTVDSLALQRHVTYCLYSCHHESITAHV